MAKNEFEFQEIDQENIDDDDHDEAQKILKLCENSVKLGNFTLATEQFKSAITASGDAACFFFGDIVRILVEGGYIVIEDLYTELGITDEAREKLLSLPDNILKSALEIYSRGKKMKL